MRLRSLLFVPGDRPDRMEKALGAGADALILDLEDAVAPAAKPAARREVAAFLAAERRVPLWVRVNPLDSAENEADLEAVTGGRPDAGIVTFEHRMLNQRDELVCVCERTALMQRRSQ